MARQLKIEDFLDPEIVGYISYYGTPDWGTQIECIKPVGLFEHLAPLLSSSDAKYTIVLHEYEGHGFSVSSITDFDDIFGITVFASTEELMNDITVAIEEFYEQTVKKCHSEYRTKTFIKDTKEFMQGCGYYKLVTNEVEPIVFQMKAGKKRNFLRYSPSLTVDFKRQCGMTDFNVVGRPKNKVPTFTKYDLFDDENNATA